MRLALLSDIHGNLPALEAVVRDLGRRGADAIVCLGDNLSGPLMPRETAQYLMASGWHVLAGNHERQILSLRAGEGGASDVYAHAQLGEHELAWLRSLQPTATYADDVFLCHGTPASDCQHFVESLRGSELGVASADEIRERLGTVTASLVACGHSHVPRCVRTDRGQLVVNPGSVGLQAYVDDHPRRHVVENGTPDARYALVERHGATWRCALHAVPYDAAEMARLAAQRGRPEWAQALLRGYVQ